jgi:hypothetical protein
MPSWGNRDAAANAPYWAVNSTIVNEANTKINASAPTAENVAKLYANTTANVYTVGETIGLFAVDTQEVGVRGTTGSGWVLKTTGSGNRAGRVQEELLVAISSFTTLDGDAQVYANVAISLAALGTKSVVAGGGNTAIFTETSTLTGNTAAALTYQWQVNASGTWGNVANGTPANTTYANATTSALTITPTYSDANGYKYRVIVTAADQGVTATSANGTLTVTFAR